jgi:hypothetical protein
MIESMVWQIGKRILVPQLELAFEPQTLDLIRVGSSVNFSIQFVYCKQIIVNIKYILVID